MESYSKSIVKVSVLIFVIINFCLMYDKKSFRWRSFIIIIKKWNCSYFYLVVRSILVSMHEGKYFRVTKIGKSIKNNCLLLWHANTSRCYFNGTKMISYGNEYNSKNAKSYVELNSFVTWSFINSSSNENTFEIKSQNHSCLWCHWWVLVRFDKVGCFSVRKKH